MCQAPRPAITRNQITITGPNSLATFSVPRACTRNRMIRSTKAAAVISFSVTRPSNMGMSFSPWNAPSTEMAGVMMASP